MPRRRLRPGQHGAISAKKIAPARFEARVYYCDRDGERRELRRTGRTKTAAEAALQDRLDQIVREVHTGEVSSNARFRTVAEAWLKAFEETTAIGGKSPTSARLYRSNLRNHLLPRLGALAMSDIRPSTLDAVLRTIRVARSLATAQTSRSVLNNIGAYAVLTEAWPRNYARDVGELADDALIEDDTEPDVTVVEAEQVVRLRADVARAATARRTDDRDRDLGARGLIWTQVPDLLDGLLALGCRVGELVALRGSSFYRDKADRPVIAITGHVVRDLDGQVVRRPYRKASKRHLVLVVPAWSVPMWARLKLAAGERSPMFPGMRGGWQHPEQVSKNLSKVFDDAGWSEVTARVMRATVGDVLDEAGHSAIEVAAQLGNTPVVARRHYTRTRARNDAQAEVIDRLLGPSASG